MTSPLLRWTRALLLTAVALSTGTVAHAAAGGLLPGPIAMAGLVILGTCIAAALLGRPASRVRVVLMVVAGQSMVHVALAALAGHTGEPTTVARMHLPLAAGPREGTFFDQTMPRVPAELGTPAWLSHLVTDLTGPHALMAVAHLVAAALVGLWLAAGERALTGLLQLAVRRDVAPLPAIPSLRDVTPAPSSAPLITALWRDIPARRGPPYAFAC